MSKVLGSVMGVLPFYLFTFLPLQATSIKSPNGNVELTFVVEQGRPVYSMTYKGREVIKPSHLGLELAKDKHATLGVNEHDLMDDFVLVEEKTSTFDETWQPVWGETRDIRNHYNELYVKLLQEFMMPRTKRPADPNIHERPATVMRELVLRFRVYDDGIGFRYEFPQQHSLSYFLIKEERTEFALTGDHTAWWLPGDYDTQEQETQQTRLSEIRGRMQTAVNWGNSSVAVFSPTGVQTSLQMKTDDGLYINIHEAACLDYATMHLELVWSWLMLRRVRLPPSWKAIAMPTHLTQRPPHGPCPLPSPSSVILPLTLQD